MGRISSISREALNGEDLVCRGGTVLSVEGDLAQVRIDQEKGCETCASKNRCAVMLDGRSVLTVRNNAALSAGMRVEVGLRPAAIFTASVILFVFPAIAFFIGIVFGYWLANTISWPEQWTGFGLGAAMFGLSFLAIKVITPRLEAGGNYEPVITRVLEGE